MWIHEAVREAIGQRKLIKRKAWTWGDGKTELKILPTNSSDCCIGIFFEDGREVSRTMRWNPNAGDLSADDWELTEQPETNRKKLRYTVSEYPMLGLATISFQLQLRGWKKLEQSKFWKKASERIAEAQTG